MKNGREREVTERVDDVEVAGYAVNEEVMNGEVEGWAGTNFDSPEQVKMGRKEELELMIKELDMFEFGTYEEAVSRGGKEPTTTKWVDRWKADDEGGRFVRCRLDGRDFKAKGVEEREVFFVAMPHLESKKLMFWTGGCGEGAAEEKGARGGEADVY